MSGELQAVCHALDELREEAHALAADEATISAEQKELRLLKLGAKLAHTMESALAAARGEDFSPGRLEAYDDDRR